MGRLILFLLALILAIYAQSLMADAELFAPFVARDGLILSAVAALLFGLGCRDNDKSVAELNSPRDGFPLSRTIAWLVIILLLGGVVRYWAMNALPAQCIGGECSVLMRLAEPNSVDEMAVSAPPIFMPLVQLMANFVESPIDAIRWSGVLIGTLTLLAVFLFARQLTSTTAALITTAILAQLPWHIWASASADSRIAWPLLICAAGWVLFNGIRLNKADGRRRLAIISAALVFVAWLVGRILVDPSWNQSGPASIEHNWLGLLGNLFYQGNFGTAGTLLDGPLLGWLLGSLSIVGFAALLFSNGQENRRSTNGARLIIWLGILVNLLVGWLTYSAGSTDPLSDSPASQLLVLLPAIVILAALAVDQIVAAFQAGWMRLIDARRLAFAALAIALIWPALTIGGVLDSLSAIAVRGENPLDPLLIEYLSDELPSRADEPVTYLVPPYFFNNPASGIQIGPAFEEAVELGRVRPFDLSQDIVGIGSDINGSGVNAVQYDPAGELVYLINGNDSGLIDLMVQQFPDSFLELQPNNDPENAAQLMVVRVAVQSILDSRGLQQSLYPGNDPAAVSRQPLLELVRAPLAANWDQLPIDGSFSSEWRGTLLIPESGSYSFQAQNHPDARLRLMLDNVNVLDTGSGISFGELELARGPYRITARYQSEPLTAGEQPAVFSLTWQPPDERSDAIPITLLQNKLPPDVGLLGYYYTGELFQDSTLAFQKDLVLGMEANLPKPYSVLWRGKLAASRSGEYQLGVLTDGRAALRIDGQIVVDAMIPDAAIAEPNATDSAETDATDRAASADNRRYVEGLVYLQRGWRDIEIAYVPTENDSTVGSSGLELFWIPPGSGPATLPINALAPYVGGLSLLEYPLPAAPALQLPYLGDSQFSLSLPSTEVFAPASALPENLPSIGSELVWQTQTGCGSGPDQFQDLHGVAIDPETGGVYIADTGNRRVVLFDFDGFPERIFASEAFQEPFEVALQFRAETGALSPLVLDAVSQQIFRLDPNESGGSAVTPISLGTSFYRPRGFGVDDSGNIAVADTGGARVVLLTPDGNVLFEAGGRESALGLGQPVDAISVGGRLWALTAEDGRLWQVSSNANESGSVAAVAATDTLNGPRLAAVRNGGLFVADPVRGTVTYHAPNGQPFLQWRDPSVGAPVGIDLALVNDVLYMSIADRNSCSVSLWRLDRAVFGL